MASSTFPYGVPPGGLTGQTLTKVSAADSDCGWASAGGVTSAWPIGAIFLSVVSTDPATLLGVGTWAALGAGRVLVGLDTEQSAFDTVRKTGGETTHTLTVAEMPAHTHVQDAHTHTQDAHTHTQNSFAPRIINSGTAGTVGVQGASAASNANASNAATTATNQTAIATNQSTTATNQTTGGDGAHNNLQPYLVVYMWERVA